MKLSTILLSSLLSVNSFASTVEDMSNNVVVTASNNYVSKQVSVSDFKGVEIRTFADVVYSQKSGKPTIALETSDNIIDLIDIYVNQGNLIISVKKGYSLKNVKKLNVKVTSADMNSFTIKGSGNIKSLSDIQTSGDFSAVIYGSGDIVCKAVSCSGNFNADMKGSGNIAVEKVKSEKNFTSSVYGSGDLDIYNASTLGNANITVAGSGDLIVRSLQCKDLETRCSGSGDIDIYDISSTNVRAHVSGSGNALLKGKAVNSTLSVTGSGDLKTHELIVNEVKASVSGSGDITCYPKASLEASKSGSGYIQYKGNPNIVIHNKNNGVVRKMR